ncbi:hypothetical protein AWB77_01961 [Caballeronia fortuita]|uniref:Uncharacterized protein n=1 Tax=Caballeronia fortuita TaxID=1777138 RepID=A0A158APB5_9BURK|nr:hypothetical protein AWB77_01961 [Caballeronia fortuita]
MSVVGVIGAIVFFAIVGLALLAVFEIIFSPGARKKADQSSKTGHKRPTWYRRREVAVRRDEP